MAPQDHYEILGIKESASDADIKAAWRKFAREYHPDSGHAKKKASSGDLFIAGAEAYRVLSDSDRRRDYDAVRERARRPEDPPPFAEALAEPVCCSVCGRPTAQPRHIVFKRVASFLVRTTIVNVQGVFCATCARAVALRSSLSSALFGWWALPWGPAATLEAIVRNACGGRRDAATDARLMWASAVAFSHEGKMDLALALAARLIDAADPAVAHGAREALAANRVQPRTLTDSWRFSFKNFLLHILMAVALPLLIVLYFVLRRYGVL